MSAQIEDDVSTIIAVAAIIATVVSFMADRWWLAASWALIASIFIAAILMRPSNPE